MTIPTSLPRQTTPTIRVWARTEAGRGLAHPSVRRSPGTLPDGVSVPNDAFTARRLIDGDWTAEKPAARKPPAPATTIAAADSTPSKI